MRLKIKYIDKEITPMKKFDNGDLIDLRVSKVFINGEEYVNNTNKGEVNYYAGDIVFVKLGFAMQMPKGYKANVYPRSSTFKNYGLILTNSVGQIDNAYCGNDDEWCGMFYCLRDGKIGYNDRVLQMEVVKAMESVEINVVEELESHNRGGYGSTGKQ